MLSDFWITFIGGIASGIVLVVLTTLIRRLLRRRAEGEPVKLGIKELRPLVAIVIGFGLIFIDIFLVGARGFLMGLGGLILMFSAYEFLS